MAGTGGSDGQEKSNRFGQRDLGKTYDVAAALDDLPEAPTAYSTSGDYDIFTMFRLENNDDIGHYVCETVQKIEGVRDTNTIVCFNPFTKDRGI